MNSTYKLTTQWLPTRYGTVAVRTLGVLVPLAIVALFWQLFSKSGFFPARLFPSVETIAQTFGSLLANGLLLQHAGATAARLLMGFFLGAVVGVCVGIGMGRSRLLEELILPLLSVLNPIPALAWMPILVLWFGFGEGPAVGIVFAATIIPVALHTWTGVKGVRPIWIRVAKGMNASDTAIFWKVVLPGASPAILAGLRVGLSQSWRAVVAAEMVAATTWGLGWMIFGSREFLRTDVMLAGIIAIAIMGLALEEGVVRWIEKRTLVRWGMLAQ